MRMRFLVAVGFAWSCSSESGQDGRDASLRDTAVDGAQDDGGGADTGHADAGSLDASVIDGGSMDAGSSDTGTAASDTGVPDAFVESDAGLAVDAGPEIDPPVVLSPDDEICRAAFVDGAGEPTAVLSTTLASCPRVRAALVWQSADGVSVAYDAWTTDMKNRLQTLYGRMLAGEPSLGVDCPNPDAQQLRGDPTVATYELFLPAAQAFDLYSVAAAHVLYREATRALPWTIAGYTAWELRELLASYPLVARIRPVSWGRPFPAGIVDTRDFTLPARNYATPSYVCDPRVGFRYMNGASSSGDVLIESGPRRTLERLSLFTADAVGHGDCGFGDDSVDCLVGNYAFDLADRLQRIRDGRIVAPQGCHSAANLMYDLARAVNIPLLVVKTEEDVEWARPSGSFLNNTHEGLVAAFDSAEPRLLLHTDDLYANGLMSFAPVDSRGRRVASAIKARMLFETTWLTLAQWDAMGVTVDETFAYLSTETDHARAPLWTFATMYDYGRLAGGFRSVEGTPAPMSSSSYARAYRDAQLCGAWWLVKPYCDSAPSSRATFRAQIESGYPGLAFGEDLLGGLTADDVYARLVSCVDAWDTMPGAGDGCANFQANYDEWIAAPASTYVP